MFYDRRALEDGATCAVTKSISSPTPRFRALLRIGIVVLSLLGVLSHRRLRRHRRVEACRRCAACMIVVAVKVFVMDATRYSVSAVAGILRSTSAHPNPRDQMPSWSRTTAIESPGHPRRQPALRSIG